jgi:4-aminobutyrate aminotransferase
VIFEPVQGVGGFVLPPAGVLAAISDVVAAHGGLSISDEVQTGWGRTGVSYFGFGLHAVRPDMFTFAKGLANGLPIGGVVARAEVMDCIGAHSISTFGGNPLVAAAANATLDYIDSHDLVNHVDLVGAHLLAGLRSICDESPCVKEVRGVGLMVAIEFDRSKDGGPDPDAAIAMLEALRVEGVLVGRGGLDSNVLRIAPPMSVTIEEVDAALDCFERALRRISVSPAPR